MGLLSALSVIGYQNCLRTQLAKGCALRTNREVKSLNFGDWYTSLDYGTKVPAWQNHTAEMRSLCQAEPFRQGFERLIRFGRAVRADGSNLHEPFKHCGFLYRLRLAPRSCHLL